MCYNEAFVQLVASRAGLVMGSVLYCLCEQGLAKQDECNRVVEWETNNESSGNTSKKCMLSLKLRRSLQPEARYRTDSVCRRRGD